MAEYSLESYVRDTIKSFFAKLSTKIKHLDALEPELNEVSLKFFVLECRNIDGEDIVFLPTGTASRPKGLRSTQLKHCVTYNFNDENHVPYIISVPDLHKFVKLYAKDESVMKRDMGWQDYETMGFHVKYEDLANPLLRISPS